MTYIPLQLPAEAAERVQAVAGTRPLGSVLNELVMIGLERERVFHCLHNLRAAAADALPHMGENFGSLRKEIEAAGEIIKEVRK
jgi:hypothetical protein